MQLAGSPPAAACWACTCCTSDTPASQNQTMRISYFLLCCMAAQGRHEAQSYTFRNVEFRSLGEIDPWEGSVPPLFSCALLSLLLWLLCFSKWRALRSSKLCSDNWLCSSFMLLFFWHFFSSSVHRLKPVRWAQGPLSLYFGSPVWESCMPELHVSVLSLGAIVGACVSIRKFHEWFHFISKTLVLSTALINIVQKEPERDREVIPHLFIKTDLFQSFKFCNPNCLRLWSNYI